MNWMAGFLSITALTLGSCQSGLSATQEKTSTAVDGLKLMDGFPFKIEHVDAFNAPSSISVYFYGPSDVVALAFDKSETCGSDIPVQLNKKRGLTHYSGDNIARYVLPAGAVPPFPPDYEYTQQGAVSGLIRCQILPSEDLDTQLYNRVLFSLTDVRLEDGSVFSTEPTELVAGIFPP